MGDEILVDEELDLERTWEKYSSILRRLDEEIDIVMECDDVIHAKWRFNFVFVEYRQFERFVYQLTPYLSEADWDEIEKLRRICKTLNQLYGDKHNIYDIEP